MTGHRDDVGSLADRPDSEFDELICRVVERLEAGESVDLSAIAAQAPGHADRLRKILPALQAMVALGHTADNLRSDAATGAKAGRRRESPLVESLLGDFRLLHEIGCGGMGVVYEAEQVSLGRRVALKVLPFAAMLGELQLKRFHNEARAAATLHHEHIVPVYYVGCDRGVHFYAMQLISGQSLDRTIQQMRAAQSAPGSGSHAAVGGTTAHAVTDESTKPLAATSKSGAAGARAYFNHVAQLGIQAADALHYAHLQGIVHRDVKPANLMLDDNGKLWVTDFGLAHVESDAGVTMTGDILGTLRYMSPENASGSKIVGPQCDIYSLGVTLFELATLRPAYPEKDRQQLLAQITSGEVPTARHVEARVPLDLSTIVAKATAREPGDRYASAKDFADDLRRFEAGQPIKAKPPGVLVIAGKWARRHRAVVNVAALCGVAMLMMGAAFVADRRAQADNARVFVETSLGAASTALETDDVEGCQQRLKEAQTRLEGERLEDRELTDRVASLGEHVSRYRQFLEVLKNCRYARSEGSTAELEGLGLFHVLDRPDWLEQLGQAQLPEAHLLRIRDGAYELLLAAADHATRWINDGTPPEEQVARIEKARGYLEKAASFHEKSRGHFWLSANCAFFANDLIGEAGLRQEALAAPVHHAAELFYLNRDNAWGTTSVNRYRGRYSSADSYRDHRDMLRFDPDYYNALFFMGRRLGEDHLLDESLAAWYGCVAARPRDCVAITNRAEVHRMLGQHREAEADYKLALSIRPDFMSGMQALAWLQATSDDDRVRDATGAVAMARQAESLSPQPDAALLETLAAAYAAAGEFDRAVEHQTKAVSLSEPALLAERRDRLELYRRGQPFRQGPLKKALTATLLRTAERLVDHGEVDLAVTLYDRAVSETPPPPMELWYGGSEFTEVVSRDGVFSRLEQLHPDHVHLRVARINYLVAQGRFDGAADAFDQLLALLPDDGESLYLAALVYKRAGKVDRYRRSCDNLVARFADQADRVAAQQISTTLMLDADRRHGEQANRFIEKVHEDAVRSQNSWFSLVAALHDYRYGDQDSAIRFAQRSRTLGSKSAPLHAMTWIVESMAQHKAGDAAAASERLATAELLVAGRLPGASPDRGAYLFWGEWVRCQILLEEARALIGSPARAGAPAAAAVEP